MEKSDIREEYKYKNYDKNNKGKFKYKNKIIFL